MELKLLRKSTKEMTNLKKVSLYKVCRGRACHAKCVKGDWGVGVKSTCLVHL